MHPCSAKQFDDFPSGPSGLLAALADVARTAQASGAAVAFGEIGLDYDRLFLTPKEQQLRHFGAQLDLAVDVQLPLFLHSRAASADFERLLAARLARLPRRGVVHSFTGSAAELHRLLAMGLDIGVNGCSLKSDDNVAVVRDLPLDRLHMETDGPWVRAPRPPCRASQRARARALC